MRRACFIRSLTIIWLPFTAYTVEEDNRVDCSFDNPPPEGKVCKVPMTNWSPCVKENQYNFKKKSPCIFLKLNKVSCQAVGSGTKLLWNLTLSPSLCLICRPLDLQLGPRYVQYLDQLAGENARWSEGAHPRRGSPRKQERKQLCFRLSVVYIILNPFLFQIHPYRPTWFGFPAPVKTLPIMSTSVPFSTSRVVDSLDTSSRTRTLMDICHQ